MSVKIQVLEEGKCEYRCGNCKNGASNASYSLQEKEPRCDLCGYIVTRLVIRKPRVRLILNDLERSLAC